MEYPTLFLLLHFYTWVLVGFHLFIIGAIGLFYQKKFQIKTNYYFIFIAAFLTLAEILHIFIAEFKWIEFIEMLGVIAAALLSIRLYQQMTGGK